MKTFFIVLFSAASTFLVIKSIYFDIGRTPLFQVIDITTKDGNFTYKITKGRTFEDMLAAFETYKIENGVTDDPKLYRTTLINYLKIPMWTSYKFHPPWSYPYLPQ